MYQCTKNHNTINHSEYFPWLERLWPHDICIANSHIPKCCKKTKENNILLLLFIVATMKITSSFWDCKHILMSRNDPFHECSWYCHFTLIAERNNKHVDHEKTHLFQDTTYCFKHVCNGYCFRNSVVNLNSNSG